MGRNTPYSLFPLKLVKFKTLIFCVDENILKLLPQNVKRSLVQEIITPLNTQHLEIISTPEHAKWVMECCGQGFLLPFEHHNRGLMMGIFKLYYNWIISPKNRPEGIKRQEQHFMRVRFTS